MRTPTMQGDETESNWTWRRFALGLAIGFSGSLGSVALGVLLSPVVAYDLFRALIVAVPITAVVGLVRRDGGLAGAGLGITLAVQPACWLLLLAGLTP